LAFFHLTDDVNIPGRWHIGVLHTVDGEEASLRRGERYEGPQPLVADVTHPGVMLEFSLTSFAMPVISNRLASAISSIADSDIQLVDIKGDGQGIVQLLNVIRVVRCVDESRSKVIKWTKNDHRADLAGQYRQVINLTIDPAQVPSDVHIFRVWGWQVALIVSEWMKALMERTGCHGARFAPVD
jgi:hypothetical protein